MSAGSEKDKPIGTAEIGMIRVGRAAAVQLTEQEIQAGILKTMGEVVVRDRWNPNALRAPEKVKGANAPDVVEASEPKERGWRDAQPLPIHAAKGSREEALIDAMVEKFVGPPVVRPGGEKKDGKRKESADAD